MNQLKVSKSDLTTGLEGVGWKNPVIYLFGDPYVPSDIVWPPIADKATMYAASAVWNGSQQDIPSNIVQLIDKGSEIIGGNVGPSDEYIVAQMWTGRAWQMIEQGWASSDHIHGIQNGMGNAFTMDWNIWRNGWHHEQIAPGGQFTITI